MSKVIKSLNPISTSPINIIYSGVAGTGKTYQLLQIAKQYTDCLPTADRNTLLAQLVDDLSWREVICLILLDMQLEQQELVKVPQIVAHEIFTAKAAQNARLKNLNSTVWSVLQMHSPVESKTVSCEHRASQAYFDKDESGAWHLISGSRGLLEGLTQQLAEFHQAQQDQQSDSQKSMRNERFSLVSFHQAYGYEEFVEGIRPVINNDRQAQIGYKVQDGAFLQLCQRAANDPNQRYAMLIDEINRANVARVFGELLSLIEVDKRAGLSNAMSVKLAYSGRAFSVPANVDIYATMNTQDHSLAPLDMALRRRFRFIHCPPRAELLKTIEINEGANPEVGSEIDLAQILKGLNTRILQTLGQEAQLGHAYLLAVATSAQLQRALVEQIIPQLAQAAADRLDILQYLFNDAQQPHQSQFIQDPQAIILQATSAQSSSSPSNLSDNARLDYNIRFEDSEYSENQFSGQNLAVAGYIINADLLAGEGEFARVAVYQRLY